MESSVRSVERAATDDRRSDAGVPVDIYGRLTPFVAALLFGVMLIPLQDTPVDAPKLAVALASIAALGGASLVLSRSRGLPSWMPRTIPFVYLMIIALLRDATGGVFTGYGALLFLAPFWVALYDSRRQVVLVVLAMFVALAAPAVATFDIEDLTAIRRAAIGAAVIGFIALAVQRNVAGLRIAKRSLAISNRRLERSNAALEAALQRESATVERLTDIDHIKSRFVAMASHELRTPLTSISGFSSTLRARWDEIGEQDRWEYMVIIDEQSERLAKLVDDLLVLSRIESGALHTHPVPVPLDLSIRGVLSDLGIDTFVDVDVPVTATVHADPGQLELMIANYMTNAVKYGGAPICVDTTFHDRFIDVVVRDNGAGVPEDVAPNLFEEFVRGEAHAAAQIEGTGLGLSIVRGLARAQGGEAWYEPNHPHGAAFGLRLPLATGTDD